MKQPPLPSGVLPATLSQEFAGAMLGDTRLSRRLVRVAERLACQPSASLPTAMHGNAELEAAYDLLAHPEVTPKRVLKPHMRATLQHCQQHAVVRALHDSTELAFGGTHARAGLGPISGDDQGFLAHVALMQATDASRQPLGVLHQEFWTRTPPRRGGPRPHFNVRTRKPDKESLRWRRGCKKVGRWLARFAPGCRVIHVMDREADAYPLLAGLVAQQQGFVVRVCQDRGLVMDAGAEAGTTLFEALRHARWSLTMEVPLSRRTAQKAPRAAQRNPARDARVALLTVSALPVRVRRPAKMYEPCAEELALNLVRVLEVDAPEGEEPVEWMLLTTEPIETVEDLLAIVEHYTARWMVEDLFKALKTGCAAQSRQLETAKSLMAMTAVCLPLAWGLLSLRHLSRAARDLPAHRILDDVQLQVLQELSRIPVPENPTVGEATDAIASIAGHRKNNGPPGWKLLAQGLHELLRAAHVWRAAARFYSQSSPTPDLKTPRGDSPNH